MVKTSGFQPEDTGSIPVTRLNKVIWRIDNKIINNRHCQLLPRMKQRTRSL